MGILALGFIPLTLTILSSRTIVRELLPYARISHDEPIVRLKHTWGNMGIYINHSHQFLRGYFPVISLNISKIGHIYNCFVALPYGSGFPLILLEALTTGPVSAAILNANSVSNFKFLNSENKSEIENSKSEIK